MSREEFKELHELAAQIAAHLGEGWSYDIAKSQTEDRLYWSATVQHTQGYGLHLSESGGRLRVYGGWPMDAKRQVYYPYDAEERVQPITISMSKSPLQIAKEIGRRFIARYVQVWNQCKARAEAADRYVQAQKDNFAYLQEACPHLEKRKWSNEEGRGHIHKGDIYGDVTCNKDSVSLELRSLSVEQAYQILKLLG